eukprot:NODE_1166_length_1858_cov_85.490490_g1106_i0.p1 GENE.NODE_1166_length_1858_cov_85.490490_g1106_i0~~NODE_1166_length_1858_cov_85.490490_g1106_i0.p1  ORF type:complete len:602 (-),score=81.91 NODE_1166_length_1858_cov_85.490490_g1106_i0:5-1810(-)
MNNEPSWPTSTFFNVLAMVTTLRFAVSGGDRLQPQWVDGFYRAIPQAQLFISYGPTETTGHCSISLTAPGQPVTIGRARPNQQLFVLDTNTLKNVDVGQEGSLFIGGLGVATGYLARPTITADRFIACPFGPAGSRMYRSGDLVRWLPHGEVLFCGREDTQVKVRGFRVELAEIEVAMAQMEGVRSAVVSLSQDAAGDGVLIGYYVGTPVDTKLYQSALAKWLPHYMIPSYLVHLEAYPLLPSGKLDRKSLPSPAELSAGAPQPSPAVATPTDAPLPTAPPASVDAHNSGDAALSVQVLNLMAELFGQPSLNPNDHFTAAGGNSILAVRLVGGIQQRFRVRLPLRTVLQAPTLQAIVDSVVKGAQSSAPTEQDPRGPPALAPSTAAAQHHTPPTSSSEGLQVVAKVLGKPSVDAQSSFTAAGGNSILAVRLVGALREKFGVRVPLRAVLQDGTIADLLASVHLQIQANHNLAETHTTGESTTRPGGIPGGPLPQQVPITAAQRRMLLLHRTVNTPAYNSIHPLQLRGTINAAALQSALDAVVQRHASFRSTYHIDDEGHAYCTVHNTTVTIEKILSPSTIAHALPDMDLEAYVRDIARTLR